jgi:hypothetical protein
MPFKRRALCFPISIPVKRSAAGNPLLVDCGDALSELYPDTKPKEPDVCSVSQSVGSPPEARSRIICNVVPESETNHCECDR